MKNTKFIQILRTLNKEEFKKFGKFLNSPVFNTNKTLFKLYNILKPYYPEFNGGTIDNEKIFRKLYPNEVFKDKKMRNLSSEMLSNIKAFMARLQHEVFDIWKQVFIMREFSERGLSQFAISQYQKSIRNYNKNSFNDIEFLYARYIFEETYKATIFSSQYKIAKNFNVFQNFINHKQELLSAIALVGLIEKNLFICRYQSNINSFLLNSIIDHLEIGIHTYSKSIQLFFKLYQLTCKTPNYKLYLEVKNMLNNKRNKITPELKHKVRSVLLNYILENLPKEFPEYYSEQLEIMGDPKERLIGGVLRDNVFNLYVINYIYSKKFHECKDFILKYSKYLEPTMKNNIVNFCMGKMYFAQKEYEHSLQYLFKCKNKRGWYEMNIKCTVLISYIELGRYNEAISLIKIYKKFLRQDGDLEAIERLKHTNFLSITELLVQFYITKQHKLLSHIRNNIGQFKEITQKTWLLEKIDAINEKLQLRKNSQQ